MLPKFSFGNSNQENESIAIQTTTNYILSDSSILFNYPTYSFLSGTEGVLKPEIFKKGGAFSYRRVSSGVGALSINLRSGVIAFFASDPGVYEISYHVDKKYHTVTIIVVK